MATPGLIAFRAAGTPITQGSKTPYLRNGQVRLVESGGDRLKFWRQIVATSARAAYQGDPLVGPVELHLLFRMEKPASYPKKKRTWPIKARSGDLDKLARAACDSLHGVAFLDDAQVVRLVAEKDWADGRGPGVEVVVMPVREEQ